MFNLTGKVSLITGASSGIGHSIALALSQQGAKIAIAARRVDRLTELSGQLKNQGKEVLIVHMDVTKKDDVAKGIAQIIAVYGKLDILINNAGVYKSTPVIVECRHRHQSQGVYGTCSLCKPRHGKTLVGSDHKHRIGGNGQSRIWHCGRSSICSQ